VREESPGYGHGRQGWWGWKLVFLLKSCNFAVKNWDSVDVAGYHPMDVMAANVGVANVSSQCWCDCKWCESDMGYIVWIQQEMPLV
jgi:hypothetical protein